jgi:ELWxxDGT repeat protein
MPDFVPYRGAYWFASGALVRTDLTPAGTALVLPSDASPDPFYSLDRLALFAGSLIFIAQRGDPYAGSYVLYRSDGTAKGTTSLGEVGTNDLGFYFPPPSAIAGPFLYFVSSDAEHGQELWRTDGTPAGTVPVADLFPGSGSSAPLDLTPAGDRLFFTADDGEHGRELWVTRGTPGDPQPVGRRTDGTLSLSPAGLTVAGDTLFFSADDGVNGRELWLLPLTPTTPDNF